MFISFLVHCLPLHLLKRYFGANGNDTCIWLVGPSPINQELRMSHLGQPHQERWWQFRWRMQVVLLSVCRKTGEWVWHTYTFPSPSAIEWLGTKLKSQFLFVMYVCCVCFSTQSLRDGADAKSPWLTQMLQWAWKVEYPARRLFLSFVLVSSVYYNRIP